MLISARPESRNSDPDDGGSGGSGGVTGGTSSPTGDPGVVLYAAAALLSLTGCRSADGPPEAALMQRLLRQKES